MTNPKRTPEEVSEVMRKVHSYDTAPEIALQSVLREQGVVYEVHSANLPGKPDIVLTSDRVAVFVDGEFWHGHDCKAGHKRPKANEEYWAAKLAHNRDRDTTNQALLRAQGWDGLIVWECDLKRPDNLTSMICHFLSDAGEAQHHAWFL